MQTYQWISSGMEVRHYQLLSWFSVECVQKYLGPGSTNEALADFRMNYPSQYLWGLECLFRLNVIKTE